MSRFAVEVEEIESCSAIAKVQRVEFWQAKFIAQPDLLPST